MAHGKPELLDLLKLELTFIEGGGYRSLFATTWHAPNLFEDSPTCLNSGKHSRPDPCSGCSLLELVPEHLRKESFPCRFIPCGPQGETVDYYYRYATQEELEEAVKEWLRIEISRLEALQVRTQSASQPAA